jgi:2-oxoglutarate ferredoxin oxidoreductase subunit delta
MEEVKEKKNLRVVINAAWCKSCGICIELCPKGALVRDNRDRAVWAHPDKCIRCGLCELRCPDLAIILQESEEEE